ncbi:MAG: proteasome-associated ATPase, partial [Actinomycetota bacterium]
MADIERDALIAEIEQLRSRLSDLPGRTRELEEKLLATKGQLSQAEMQRDRLTSAVRDLRDQVEALRQEVSVLSQPPSNYAVLVDSNEDGTFDIMSNGRKLRVRCSPDVDPHQLHRGAEVLLNDSQNIILVRASDSVGEVVTIVEVLADGIRAIVSTRGDENRVVELGDALRGSLIRSGDTYRLDIRSNILLERLPQPEVEDLLLEEVPDVRYSDIGGLNDQIEQIADAVE